MLHRFFCLLEDVTDELPKWWLGSFSILNYLDMSDQGEPIGPRWLRLRRAGEEIVFTYHHAGVVFTLGYLPPGHFRRAGRHQYRG
jgi:hypothetical protein